VMAIIDSGATVDVISQSFAVSLGLKPAIADLPRSYIANDAEAFCYGAYWVTARVKDDFSQERLVRRLYYAINRKEPLIFRSLTIR